MDTNLIIHHTVSREYFVVKIFSLAYAKIKRTKIYAHEIFAIYSSYIVSCADNIASSQALFPSFSMLHVHAEKLGVAQV